jgi:hypothetical protein
MTPEEWVEAVCEDPSCIEAYLAEARHGARAAALEEAARLAEAAGDVPPRLDSTYLRCALIATRIRALANGEQARKAVEGP